MAATVSCPVVGRDRVKAAAGTGNPQA